MSNGLVSLNEDEGGSGEDKRAEDEKTPAQEAEEILDAFKEQARKLRTTSFMADFPPEKVGEWWKMQEEGPLKAVARAVLGQCPSSAPLENSFSTAADITTRRRSGMDPGRVEMLLVCNIMRRHLHKFPIDDIKDIPRENVNDFLPSRFTRDDLKTQLEAFTAVIETAREEEDGAEDEVEDLAGWSSLAEWGIEELDVDDDEDLRLDDE